MMKTPRVLISILNWNKADETLDCLAALRKMKVDNGNVDILVIDNGSAPEDYVNLQQGIESGSEKILRVETNLGFTGGHNLAMRLAMKENYDFIWLLNNDAVVQGDALEKLIYEISVDPRCGAVSPVIYAENGIGHLNAWGATHDWRARNTAWMPSAAASMKLHETDPDHICLAGTAILFRVQAIREVGVLDERLFAYFDDNDIGTRLSRAGWRSKVVFDTGVIHGTRHLSAQPPYFFYLMFRNELIFWHTHMPQPFRKLLWLKLVNQAVYNVNRLIHRGMSKQADAAMLGVWDFILGQHGAPDLSRNVPLAARLMRRILQRIHAPQLIDVKTTEQGLPMAHTSQEGRQQ